jgi:hypothetical protein
LRRSLSSAGRGRASSRARIWSISGSAIAHSLAVQRFE